MMQSDLYAYRTAIAFGFLSSWFTYMLLVDVHSIIMCA